MLVAKLAIVNNNAFRGVLDDCSIEPDGIAQSIFTELLGSHVTRQRQYLLRITGAITNRAHDYIPPAWLLPYSGREKASEASDLSPPRLLNGRARRLPVRGFPEINPRLAKYGAEIADFQFLHATFVHEYEAAFQVKHLDAVAAARNQAGLEFFAGAQSFERGPGVALSGLHLELIVDSDNAAQTIPIDEVDSEQRMVVLQGNPGNVGDRFGRSSDVPLILLARPFA